MRVVFFRIGLMFTMAWAATAFLAPRCKAQSEVSPDHFDGTDSWVVAPSALHPAKPAASAEKVAARTQQALLVKIPFAFTAGRMALPAGEYRFQKSAQNSPALSIQRTDERTATSVSCVAARAKTPQTQSKLVFRRYGSRYFLSNVWTAGSSLGRELPRSAKERDLALVTRDVEPDQVTIVASLFQPRP